MDWTKYYKIISHKNVTMKPNVGITSTESVIMKDKEVIQSVELLWAAAQTKKGRGFTPTQIAHIVQYLSSLSILLMKRESQVIELEKNLDAYADGP